MKTLEEVIAHLEKKRTLTNRMQRTRFKRIHSMLNEADQELSMLIQLRDCLNDVDLESYMREVSS